jgi:hypothetical protein
LPSARRRTREEFERDNDSPPRSNEHYNKRTAFESVIGQGFGSSRYEERDGREGRGEDDWKRGMGSREKKEEFLRLCERAWDLFHS